MHCETIGALQKEAHNAVSPSRWLTQPPASPAWSLPLPGILSSAPKRASKHQPNRHATTHSYGKATAGETHLATALPVRSARGPAQEAGWRRRSREGEGSSGIPPAEILKIGEEGWRLPLKDELHLIPASHDGALLSRS